MRKTRQWAAPQLFASSHTLIGICEEFLISTITTPEDFASFIARFRLPIVFSFCAAMALVDEIKSRNPQINILITFTSEVYKQSPACAVPYVIGEGVAQVIVGVALFTVRITLSVAEL